MKKTVKIPEPELLVLRRMDRERTEASHKAMAARATMEGAVHMLTTGLKLEGQITADLVEGVLVIETDDDE